jgi:transposase
LIGDKAYDFDPLDAELAEAGIEMIALHKSNRKKAPTQDRRVLRCYKRRWKVGRLFSWLQKFRRIAIRFDVHEESYVRLRSSWLHQDFAQMLFMRLFLNIIP